MKTTTPLVGESFPHKWGSPSAMPSLTRGGAGSGRGGGRYRLVTMR